MDQFINDSIHIENDVFENLPTTRRVLPVIAGALESLQTKQHRRHAVFEIMGQPPLIREELFAVEEIVRADPGWVAAVRPFPLQGDDAARNKITRQVPQRRQILAQHVAGEDGRVAACLQQVQASQPGQGRCLRGISDAGCLEPEPLSAR